MDKEQYLKYLLTLDIENLKIEATNTLNYLDNLVETYNDLINILENDIVEETKNILNFKENKILRNHLNNKLHKLQFYLEIEVESFLNSKKEVNEIVDSYDRDLSQAELLDDIMFNYSLIYEVNEYQSPLPDSKNQDKFKFLNYSWFDALRLLHDELINKVDSYLVELSTLEDSEVEWFAEKLLIEIIELTEEYCDHYLDLSRCYKDLLSEENYKILTKYNCFNNVIKVMKSNVLKSFDFTDFKNFFNNSSIVKIINNDRQITLSSIKPNKFLIMGFSDCNSLEEIHSKIAIFKEHCSNTDCEYIFAKCEELIVIYLFKE